MKSIEYRVQFADPALPGCEDKIVCVQARDINSGFRKAVAEALRRWPYEFNRVEFWQVVSERRLSDQEAIPASLYNRSYPA